MDLSLNRNFSVHLDHQNDVGSVEGRQEFEQSVAVHLTSLMYNSSIGVTDRDLVRQQLRLEANRVARDHDLIDAVHSIDVSQSDDAPSTYEVSIIYESQAVSEMLITE